MLQGLAIGQWVGAPTLGEPEPAVGGRTKSGGRWWIEHQSPGRIDALQDEAWGRHRKGGSAPPLQRTQHTPARPPRARCKTRPPETQWAGSPTEILDNLHTTLLDWVTAVNTNTETLAAGDAD
ncbi:hypothetical protein DKM27_24615 [Mycobacterium tuberculosis variant bovis]|nr:hypothetical protein DKM27_24615 [Mycobacterium tuberculosis variant bovis]